MTVINQMEKVYKTEKIFFRALNKKHATLSLGCFILINILISTIINTNILSNLHFKQYLANILYRSFQVNETEKE